MENTTKLTIGGFFTLALIISGAIIIPDAMKEKTYYCADLDLVGYCVNGVKACDGDNCTRCYFNENNSRSYRFCASGWEPIKDHQELASRGSEIIDLFANGENYRCPTEKGKVQSYTVCVSDNGKQGYLGELV